MRVRRKVDGVTVHAISGTHVNHLAFDVSEDKRHGLLGFAIKREDLTEQEADRWIPNKRGFSGQQGNGLWPTNEAPVQKFRWGDYTAKPLHEYVYTVYPAFGRPGAIKLGRPITVPIRSEDPDALLSANGTVHQIHFSRSGAASQAYVRRFGVRTPEQVPGGAAYRWLSRGLLEAMLAFIDRAQPGDELAIAIYEIQYEPILARLKAAVARGVDVKIVYDAGTDETGPKEANEKEIRKARLRQNARPRAGLRSYISHHKFMVLVHQGIPAAVWTGSTNMSLHGIFAQLNVGHTMEDEAIARAYLELHQELWGHDPSAKDTRSYMVSHYPKVGLGPREASSFIFSPRSQEEAIDFYLRLMKNAKHLVVLTTPFGVDRRIERFLRSSSPKVVKFGLLGQASADGGTVTRLDSIDGTHYAMPARIQTPLDQWQKERFGFKSHAYIHTKFLLIDPLSAAPVLVTGSANFSRASCVNNDEDMLVISDHAPAADVYLTEFLRMFEHYAFRQFLQMHPNLERELPLRGDDTWVDPYFIPGSERERARLLFSGSVAD